MPSEMAPVVVPPDQVFLLNDHRSDLSDSRQWGPISKFQMEAKAWRIWLSIDWEKNRLRWRRLFGHVD
jgi:type IV secretory pathway protease TraF